MFLAVIFTANSIFAGVGIVWSTIWGAYDHTATDLTGEDHAWLDSYGATWQLIYAGPNNAIDPPGVSSGLPGIEDDYVSGDDVVWAQRIIPLGGGSGNDAPYNTIWNNWMLNEGGSIVYTDLTWFTEGYVYQRVYEGTPHFGVYWYESDLYALDTSYTGSRPLQEFYLDTEYAGFKPNWSSQWLEPPQLEIHPASTNFSSSAASGNTIDVMANISWTAVTNVSWLAITGGSSGLGNGTVTYSVAANSGTLIRTGEVIIAGGGINCACTVVQAGASAQPHAQSDENFGVISNRFGFNINWISGRVVVVDGCTNLANPAWVSLQTNTLTNGWAYFSDPRWTNLIGRFYRIRAP